MEHKKDLSGLTVRALRARRRRLASGLSDVEALLRGTVVTQGRRCGKENCRCADGQLHGPYTLWVPETVHTARDLPIRPRQVPGMLR